MTTTSASPRSAGELEAMEKMLVGVTCDLCDKPLTRLEDVSYWEDFWTFPTECDAILCRRCSFDEIEELP